MVAKRVSRSILEIRVPPSLFLSQKCDGTRHVIIITCCSSNKVKKVLVFAIIFYFMGYTWRKKTDSLQKEVDLVLS